MTFIAFKHPPIRPVPVPEIQLNALKPELICGRNSGAYAVALRVGTAILLCHSNGEISWARTEECIREYYEAVEQYDDFILSIQVKGTKK